MGVLKQGKGRSMKFRVGDRVRARLLCGADVHIAKATYKGYRLDYGSYVGVSYWQDCDLELVSRGASPVTNPPKSGRLR